MGGAAERVKVRLRAREGMIFVGKPVLYAFTVWFSGKGCFPPVYYLSTSPSLILPPFSLLM